MHNTHIPLKAGHILEGRVPVPSCVVRFYEKRIFIAATACFDDDKKAT